MNSDSRTKWNARHQAAAHVDDTPSQVLVRLDPLLPRTGRALDVAGGRGRHALWLARRGLDVTLSDISEVGLELASLRTERSGTRLDTRRVDLEHESFPAGPWDLIVSVLYLWRPLFPAFREQLSPGGMLVVIQPTIKNLQRHAKPPADYLLAEGELRRLAGDLEVVDYEEGWLDDGRHDAVLVARSLSQDTLST